MTIQRYQITEEACRKHCVDKVCIYCGEPIEPIETVDNSGNPTFWTACMKCSRFNPGTTKEIYRKALSLREGVRTIPVEILVGIVSILCNDNLAALAEKEKQIVALTAELKSLTEAYNNTDWKKRTNEQKEIINNLTVRWGKVIRENAALTAVKDRQNDFIDKVEMAYPEFYEHHKQVLRGGEVKDEDRKTD